MRHAVSRLACMHPVRTPLRSSAAQQASSRSAYGAESANHRRGKSQERYRSTQLSTPRQACTMFFLRCCYWRKKPKSHACGSQSSGITSRQLCRSETPQTASRCRRVLWPSDPLSQTWPFPCPERIAYRPTGQLPCSFKHADAEAFCRLLA
jgi:hypothetical protein